jgi:hypothetical protein
VLAAQIAAEESALQSGTFEVLLDYGQGSRSSVIVRFDLGGAGKEKRLALTTTASGKTADPRIELLAIGDRTWQRQPDGTWGPAITQDGLWEQLQAYLPHIRGASDVTVARLGEVLILRWSDATRGADLELHVESSGGRPLRLQETIPATGMVMVVTYQGWNTPVSIGPPVP